MSLESKWPDYHFTSSEKLKEVTRQIHHAVQLLAMAGKALSKHQIDDSHTNLGWNPDEKSFESHFLIENEAFYLSLYVENISVAFNKNDREISRFSLLGKTQQDGINWVKENLEKIGIDKSTYHYNLHYDLPSHPIAQNGYYSNLGIEAYESFSSIRTIGHLVMNWVVDNFDQADPVCTWPHHFDIGTYIPLIKENNEVQKSLTIGLAIPDQYCENYYFYVNHWSKQENLDYTNLPALPEYAFWNRKDFVGAILPITELVKLNEPQGQIDRCKKIISEAINASLQILDINPQKFSF